VSLGQQKSTMSFLKTGITKVRERKLSRILLIETRISRAPIDADRSRWGKGKTRLSAENRSSKNSHAREIRKGLDVTPEEGFTTSQEGGIARS